MMYNVKQNSDLKLFDHNGRLILCLLLIHELSHKL